MATNIQSTTRPSGLPSDPAVVEPTPVVTPAGVSGVAVYDREADSTDASLHQPTSMASDLPPAEVRSTGSMLTWIISAIVLILLVYFLLQFIF
jgi:hypothetical protein